MTFLSSTRKFVKSATWLGDAEAPAVEGMVAAAKALDSGGVNAALLGQYRALHKLLLNRSPDQGHVDDDDDLLSPWGDL